MSSDSRDHDAGRIAERLRDERVNQDPEGDEHHEQDEQSRQGGGRAFANHVTDLL